MAACLLCLDKPCTVMICEEKAVRKFLEASRKLSDDKVPSLLSDRNCGELLPKVMQEWTKRAEVLQVCAQIATNPPGDDNSKIASLWKRARDHIEFQETQINPRIDSYGARDETHVDTNINAWVRREMMAEEIIRDTTNGFFNQRCDMNIN